MTNQILRTAFVPAVLFTTLMTLAPAPRALSQEMDRLTLADESSIEGLLLTESARTIEFAQIMRPAGRPMQAFIRPYPRENVLRIIRIAEEPRARLRQQFAELRQRAAIEADRIDQIALAPAASIRGPGVYEGARWFYDGEWFQLATSLPPLAAKRVIVRIEQVFRAYRHLLPPQHRPTRPLIIHLTGSEGEYRRLLATANIETASPAFYLPRQNRIVASTRLSTLARQVSDVEHEHAKIRKQQQTTLEQFAKNFSREAEKLAGMGYSDEEIAAEKRGRQAALQREAKAVVARAEAIDRRNAHAFAQASHEAMRRLYHEAFHAYLENYLLVDANRELPRWLNEGLAQVFEHAQLDGDHLRIDAAPPTLLKAMRRDLQRRPLPLSRLLEAEAASFHGRRDPDLAERLYLYSWGLAFYLVFREQRPVQEMLDELRRSPATVEGLRSYAKRHGLNWFQESDWRNAVLDDAPNG